MAAALAWVWYLLDRYPDKGENLRNELRVARVPALADINRLPYTRGVVLESLRLFPPVWVLPRTALHADTVCGFAVPPRTEILYFAVLDTSTRRLLVGSRELFT